MAMKESLRVLMIGDVVGHVGCDHLHRMLPALKRHYEVDVCVVNGENAADGNGTTPFAAQQLLNAGADVITGGNHTFRRPEFTEYLEETPYVLRPANFPAGTPGRGLYTVDLGRFQFTVINLLGVVYLEPLRCPFETLDALLEEAGRPKFCLIDFHAEATAEKKALAYYADGRVSAVIGTHTHVQTNDAQILPGGTGFLTDVGMTGPLHSVLGVKPELSVTRMRTHRPVRFVTADGPCCLDAVLLDLDTATGKTRAVTPLRLK